jgi:hypothetical protein
MAGPSKTLLAAAIVFALGTVTPAVAKSGGTSDEMSAKKSAKPKPPAKRQKGGELPIEQPNQIRIGA